MVKENKSTRTGQVQFRMNPDKVKRLLAAIAYEDNMHSMADLFNKAADEYLKNKKKAEEKKMVMLQTKPQRINRISQI